ncbi:hypothetical protein Patl1_15914 [Pistacia atlantica]|uniref:Uncharacterized protein n=1 Tax=Pistacia atlantica TaxID=434234 RepID=A0ACC1B7K3_9ROSI|nr:hypothetical protein Patl1_15914 [Pistacia atlantica]
MSRPFFMHIHIHSQTQRCTIRSKSAMPPLRGEGVTCLVLRYTHSRYENEMSPSSTRDPRLLIAHTNSGTSGRRLIEKAAQPARPFSDCDQEHTLDLTH